MTKFSFLIFIVLFSNFQKSDAQNIARGFVYEDLNRNNIMDRKEKGIEGVAVSNGVQVVSTDKDGKYELPASDDQIFFVVKPSGYSLPMNELNQPLFYYIHKPNGSPKLKYSGVSPTGALPEHINFALIPKVAAESFKILVFGDPQPYTETEVDYFYHGIVKEVEGVQGVEFGLSLGDLVGDDLNLFLPYKKALSRVGIPWHNVMGNHDENYDVQHDSLSDESFEQHFGPATYSFNQGKVHFIILDDILYPDPRDSSSYWGGFRDDQFEFLINDLKLVPKDFLIVLAFHIPISEREGWGSFRPSDRERLFQILKEFPHTLSLSAHTHFQSQDFFTQKDGWLQQKPHHHFNVGASCGDWYSGPYDKNGVPVSTMRDGTPKGYVYLNFRGNTYNFDYKVAGKPANYQFEIYTPKVVKANKSTSAHIVANFFIGAKTDSVFYRVDRGNWIAMTYKEAYDPSYMKILFDYDFSEELMPGRRPSNPDYCNHLWFARMPTKFSPGLHQIEVRAIDMFGREHLQKKDFRVVE
ncbi:MAG: calcineurin-like phosphoesterase family protein [Bacteroidales bacterium]|nr:calcineurin-like phosphoesterase family protein [Bacteroidales bacterium]